MDRYTSYESYKQAKHQIYRGAKKVVYNSDDIESHPLSDVTIDQLSFTGLNSENKSKLQYYLKGS